MDRAINKTTNKIISAFEIFNNGSYQNIDKGEWTAPKDSIYNWEELNNKDEPVHYVTEKKYQNFKGTYIVSTPHFAVYPGSMAKTVEESKEHKLLKNWLFSKLKNDDLELLFSKGVKPHKYNNKYKLSQLDINWNDFEIEVTTKGTKKLRADILLPFNNKHQLLGEGIIFEIQLSPQNNKQTHERSIERALHGYSICWLFEDNFIIEEDNIELKNNILNINSFSEQMHFAKKGFIKKLREVVEEQCRFLDEKIATTNIKLQELDNKEKEIKNSLDKYSKIIIEKIKEEIDNKEKLYLEQIENIANDPLDGIVQIYEKKMDKFWNEKNYELQGEEERLMQTFDKMIKKLNYPTTFGECNKCRQGYMTYKVTKTGKGVYSCSNYPHCNNTVWLN